MEQEAPKISVRAILQVFPRYKSSSQKKRYWSDHHLGRDKGKLSLVCGLVVEKMTVIPDRSLSVEISSNQALLWDRIKLERQ